MTSPDCDDPATVERWCAERRGQVVAYVRVEGVDCGRVGEWPAWQLAPYVSVWAIESKMHPDSVGWWVICGDLPTDYVGAGDVRHPREALRAIGARWLEMATYMAKRTQHPSLKLGAPDTWPELGPLLEGESTSPTAVD